MLLLVFAVCMRLSTHLFVLLCSLDTRREGPWLVACILFNYKKGHHKSGRLYLRYTYVHCFSICYVYFYQIFSSKCFCINIKCAVQTSLSPGYLSGSFPKFLMEMLRDFVSVSVCAVMFDIYWRMLMRFVAGILGCRNYKQIGKPSLMESQTMCVVVGLRCHPFPQSINAWN